MHRSALFASCLFATVTLASCGLPPPPNVREQFAKGIEPLGVIPFYPLKENARIGQVYMVDVSTAKPGGDKVPYVPNSVLVSDDAVPAMETQRKALMAAKTRFACTAGTVPSEFYPDQTKKLFFPAGCPQSGEASGSGHTDSLAPLELAGIPSYNIASIDQGSLSGGAPTAFSNFLAAIGYQHSASLEVEPEGVQVAELPAGMFTKAIRTACDEPGNAFSDPRNVRAALYFAYQQLKADAGARSQPFGKQRTVTAVEFQPHLYMLDKVYYLRAIRYIYKNKSLYDALLQAAINDRLKPPSKTPSIPQIPVASSQQGQNGTQISPQLQIDALKKQVADISKAITNQTSAGIAGTLGRITAQGITLTEVFSRPLAFGYVAVPYTIYSEDGPNACQDGRKAAYLDRGFDAICRNAEGFNMPKPCKLKAHKS